MRGLFLFLRAFFPYNEYICLVALGEIFSFGYKMSKIKIALPLRVSLYYALFGAIWFLTTDSLVNWLVSDIARQQQFEAYKDHIFILSSTIFVYLVLRAEFGRRTAAEAQLDESRETARQIFQNSLDAILLTEPGGNILQANPAACQMLGWTEQELIAGGRASVVDHDDSRLGPALEERARTGKFRGELNFRRRDGSIFPVEITTNLFTTADGQQRSSMILRDVSERNAVQTRVIQLNRLFATLLQVNRAITLHHDAESLFKGICEVAVKVGGYRMAWFGDVDPQRAVVNPAYAAGQGQGYLKDLRIELAEGTYGNGPTGKAYRSGHTNVCQDIANDPQMAPWRQAAGAHGFRSLAAVPFSKAGQIIGLFTLYAGETNAFSTEDQSLLDGIGADISYALDALAQQQQAQMAQQALQESEEKFFHAFQHSPAALFITNATDHTFLDVNDAFLSLFKVTRKQAIGKTAESLGLLNVAEAHPVGELAMVGTWRNTELTARDSGGRLHHVIFSTTPMQVGNKPCHISTLIDISDRKHVEQQLLESQARLEELSRMLMESQESERRTVGRELHDQVGQMLTALNVDLDVVSHAPPEVAAAKLQQAKHLAADLLNRVGRITMQLRPPILDDMGLLPALQWQINRFQEENPILIGMSHSGIEGKRFSSQMETTLYRMVQELLANIAGHSKATQAQLRLDAYETHISLQASDDGAGYRPEEAFAKNKALASLRERARLLGGELQVTSSPGNGSITLVQLPMQPPAG